jgi:hypothetical protein
MGNRVVKRIMMTALTVFAIGCSQSTAPGARVFFVSPKDGATIKPLSTIEFGSTGVTVAAVPPGELKPEQVRANTIHYHLGTDTECLPAESVIPKASPWVHFGDGKNVIEMQLPPGQHRLAVQAGDDMHRTIAGLCEAITVTVAE